MSKKNLLDKYYTNPKVVKECISFLPNDFFELSVIEPSAGSGNFINELPVDSSFLAFDLEPDHPSVEKQDFLNLDLSKDLIFNFLGNPPFGFASNLAIKFFNKAAINARYIAFIVPKTFKKLSVQEKLNKKLHLISDNTLPKNSFILEGKEYDVPCCFQVWEKKEYDRETPFAELLAKPEIFLFVSKSKSNRLVCVRRAGGKAGQLLKGWDHAETSTYWIKPLIDKKLFIEILKSLNLDLTGNTAGVKSISKKELTILINEKFYSN